MAAERRYDVVIIGAGIAGLSLARQVLLASDKTILLVDRQAEIPPPEQKVGEATVQVSGYYISKVLDLEEHLLREHFMKYNLRFYWKTPGRDNSRLEDYSQSYIRPFSNIASYQLDRNRIEGELLRLNRQSPNFDFCASASDLAVSLAEDSLHSVDFRTGDGELSVKTAWVVDTSGRGRYLARRWNLTRPNPIRHGASFLWVEGLLNVEKLTDLSPREIRLKRDRAMIGHLPMWLATNHFMGEGFWFWVIPLQGKTSLGLVYDNAKLPRERVTSPEKLVEWICEEFPLFARDLPHRKILHHASFKDFSYDCAQTISERRWALSGEAGRFTDPLYSPGGDIIALYNTLITDAILTADRDELADKVELYEPLMKALYEAYVPSYAVGYDALGDQETMTLKYAWELAIYFAFYVFPFINDLFTERGFVTTFLARFARLGRINRNMQAFVSRYYHWKKTERKDPDAPLFNDFMEIEPVRRAEGTFYRVGLSVDEAVGVLDAQLGSLRELARFIVAYVSSVVLDDERVVTNRAFVEAIDVSQFSFDPAEMRSRYDRSAGSPDAYPWSFDPHVLDRFRTVAVRPPAASPAPA